MASAAAGWIGASGSSQTRSMTLAVALPGVDLRLAARRRAVLVGGAERGALGADRPDVPAAAEQPAQAVDGGQEIAAVLLHHREQEVAAGVSGEARVLERRQPREQHAARLGFVAGQRQRALEHVAGRQHAQLVAQDAAAAAAVEHGDDGVQPQPGLRFSPPSRLGRPVPPPKQPTLNSRSCMWPHSMPWRRHGIAAASQASKAHGILWAS